MKTPKPKMPKQPKLPKQLKAPKSQIKIVNGYVKKNGTFVNPHIKGLPKF